MPFKSFKPDQGYAKVAFFGEAGAGKSWSASLFAIGLHQLLTKQGLPGGGDTPIFFQDTEGGTSFVHHLFEDAGIKVEVDRSRAAADLKPNIKAVSDVNGILIVDSISALKTDFDESYLKGKGKSRLATWDYAPKNKLERQRFTDPLINSPAHIITCGRMAYEYKEVEDEDGKKTHAKDKVKMRSFKDASHEVGLLVFMEQLQEVDQKGRVERVYNNALVVKDKSGHMNGVSFKMPTFESFLPYVQTLSLCCEHVGVDETRDSVHVVPRDAGKDYRVEQEKKTIVLEKIKASLMKKHPSQSAADKAAKQDLTEKHFHTTSWTEVGTLPLLDLEQGLSSLNDDLGLNDQAVGASHAGGDDDPWS